MKNRLLCTPALEETQAERDVGVVISRTPKPFDQCSYAAKRANQMLGILRRSFKYRDTTIWPRLYKAFVRPKLEFAGASWKPWTQQDMKMLERVQKRAVNCVTSLKSAKYEDKLRELGLTTLQALRDRGDAITIYKIINGLDNVGEHKYFELWTQTLKERKQDKMQTK